MGIPVARSNQWEGDLPQDRVGSAQQFPTEIEARAAAAGILLEINVNDPRVQTHALTML